MRFILDARSPPASRSRSTTTRSRPRSTDLGMKFAPLTVMADQLQIYKYCIQQVANV